MRRYSRDDVQVHSGGFRQSRPAVNVKVYGSIQDRDVWEDFRRDEGPDEGFTLEWIEEHISDEHLDAIFWNCCSWELEYLEGWATGSDQGEDAIFPDDRVTIEQEGRSGGWLAVDGLPPLEEWDAIRLARWRRFEKIARSIAAGIRLQMLSTIYINEYQYALDEAEEAARAANHDIATVPA